MIKWKGLSPEECKAIEGFFEEKGLPLDRAVTFDDVTVPDDYSTTRSRSDIFTDLNAFTTDLFPNLKLNVPFIAANMESVTGYEMMVAMESLGGLAILPQFLPRDLKREILDKVRRAHSARIDNPLTIRTKRTLKEAKELMYRHKIFSLVVVDEDNRPIGILGTRDWLYEDDENQEVGSLMNRKVITAPDDIDFEKARALLKKERIEKLPLVDARKRLTGLITAHGLFYERRFPRALRDKNGQFILVGSIGVGKFFTSSYLEDVTSQIEAGIVGLLIDTARAGSDNAFDAVRSVNDETFLKSLQRKIPRLRKEFPKLVIIVGNFSSPHIAKMLFDIGVNVVKVGIGPGNACTTRQVGIGIPQLTAVAASSVIAKMNGGTVIADGGVKNPGDAAKAIVAGASAVMIGRLIAGAEESAAEPYTIETEIGGERVEITVKDYIGSASYEAQKARLSRGDLDRMRRPEGRKVQVPVFGPLSYRIEDLLFGLSSHMSFVNAKDLKELREKGYFMPQTRAGHVEGSKEKRK